MKARSFRRPALLVALLLALLLAGRLALPSAGAPSQFGEAGLTVERGEYPAGSQSGTQKTGVARPGPHGHVPVAAAALPTVINAEPAASKASAVDVMEGRAARPSTADLHPGSTPPESGRRRGEAAAPPRLDRSSGSPLRGKRPSRDLVGKGTVAANG